MSLEQKIHTTLNVFRQVRNSHSPSKFATSFGIEDQVLTDLLVKHAPEIAIFTLDTGRLHQETYDVMKNTMDRYQVPIAVYSPKSSLLGDHIRAYGPNAFYESVDLRKACCFVRKVEPLQRALKGCKSWVTGLRREQAVTRTGLSICSWDSIHDMDKFNPLLDWTLEEVWDYAREHKVPYNALHDRGFPSIGCAPCTRAVAEGEDVRAGRWWWEDPVSKECGLHLQVNKECGLHALQVQRVSSAQPQYV